MKLTLFFALAGGVAAQSTWQMKFEDYTKKFGKKYHSMEEKFQRFGNFVENMIEAEKFNKEHAGTATFGMNKNSDMSQEEYAAWNALRVTPEALADHQNKAKQSFKLSDSFSKMVEHDTLPSSFDWREKGAVGAVKNQGQCGSCWSFGTVASIEGNNFVTNNKLQSFSEQELVSCDDVDQGCNGGLPQNAYQWLMDNKKGLETESDYPYKSGGGESGSCKEDTSKEVVFLDGFKAVPKNEDKIAAALMQYGPLAVAVNALGPIQQYTGGIITGPGCNSGQIDHAVTLVGFGEESGTKFWIVRNSWGAEWGEKGYFRLERGTNQCLVATLVTAAEVTKSSTDEDAVFV